MKKPRLILLYVLLFIASAFSQSTRQSIDYKFRILNQYQVYDIDPKNKLFQSEQTYGIKNASPENTRKILFGVHPLFQIQSVILKDSRGNILPHRLVKTSASDFRFGTRFDVYETETEIEIAPDQVLNFTIRYRLNPEAISDWPKDWWFLTVSQNASYAITPSNGNNIIFGLNYSSPFVVKIRHPEGVMTCAPGNRISTEKEDQYLVDTYESKKSNIPTFSCAPYKKIERLKGEYSVAFYIYPHEIMPEEMADYLFSAVDLFVRSFGDNGTRNFQVATAGPYNTIVLIGENKGNCIFMTDSGLREALKSSRGKWDYLSTLFHEVFHDWNLFSLRWNGDYREWFGEGGATFIQAWGAERILGRDAARYIRQKLIRDFVSQKGFLAKRALDKAQKESGAERALIYNYGALVWEQLRQKLGDKVFFAGLGDFFKKGFLKNVSMADLLKCWESHSKINIQEYLGPWIDHNAQIFLSVENIETRARNGKYETAVTLNVEADAENEIFTSLEYRTDKTETAVSIPLRFAKRGIQIVRFISDKEPLSVQLDPDCRVPRMTEDRLTWEK